MHRHTITRFVCAATLALFPVTLTGCPLFGSSNVQEAELVQVEGFAVAPISQLKSVSALTAVTPFAGESVYRLSGVEALGDQGYIPNARITVLDGSLQPVPGIKEGKTNDKGHFTIDLPPGRAYIIRLDFGDDKTLSLFAFARVLKNGKLKIKLDVTTTLAAHLLIRRIAQLPGLLNEFSNDEIGEIQKEVGDHLTPEDIPDLTQITSILDRVSRLEVRLAALETKVSVLEKKVEDLLNRQGITPSPIPTPTPAPLAFANIAGVNLSTSRMGATSHVIGNYLYVIGGWQGGSVLNSIERATISADGTIGSFSVVPNVSLSTPRSHHRSLVIGNFLYVIGGRDDFQTTNVPFSSVERATINGDGTISSFAAVSESSLVTARMEPSVFKSGNFLYVAGGLGSAIDSKNQRTALSTVERAQINSDGSIGAFATQADVKLVTARCAHSAVATSKYVYMLHGWNNSAGQVKTVERAAINDDGSIGSFSVASEVTLSTPRFGYSSVEAGNAVYLLGGWSDSLRFLSSIERAAIKSDGTLGAFSSLPGASLTSAQRDFTANIIGNRVYAIGGFNDFGARGNVERGMLP